MLLFQRQVVFALFLQILAICETRALNSLLIHKIYRLRISHGQYVKFSSLKNKITALSQGDADIIMAPNNLTILRVGESVGSFLDIYAMEFGVRMKLSKLRYMENYRVMRS